MYGVGESGREATDGPDPSCAGSPESEAPCTVRVRMSSTFARDGAGVPLLGSVHGVRAHVWVLLKASQPREAAHKDTQQVRMMGDTAAAPVSDLVPAGPMGWKITKYSRVETCTHNRAVARAQESGGEDE